VIDYRHAVLSFGESLWDLLPDGPVLGGAPLNLAYRLGEAGRPAYIVSRLGTDGRGREARARIRELGMDDRFVGESSEDPTGTVVVSLDENNDPSYDIIRDVAYDRIESNDALLEAAAAAACLCYGTLAQRSGKSRRTLATMLDARGGGLTLCDVNLRKECWTAEILAESLDRAELVKINEDEAGVLASIFGIRSRDLRDIGTALCRRFGLLHVIITMGPRGACVCDTAGVTAADPCLDVPRVDPCGAGDAFTAGFLASFLDGESIEECCRRGNALGSLVQGRRGATDPVASDEVDEVRRNALPIPQRESDFHID
jgi:fructokinase